MLKVFISVLAIFSTLSLYGEVTKKDALHLQRHIYELYNKEIDQKWSRVLYFENTFHDSILNAYIYNHSNYLVVTTNGGMFKHPDVDTDTLAATYCFLMGQALGGAPERKNYSAVGQATYYAHAKCLKQVFARDKNTEIMANKNVDGILQLKCNRVYGAYTEASAICQRSVSAHARFLRIIDKDISYSTPDLKEVKTTDMLHPSTQCTLDTALAGALCDVDAYSKVSSEDAKDGFCAEKNNPTPESLRPRCWFKPE